MKKNKLIITVLVAVFLTVNYIVYSVTSINSYETTGGANVGVTDSYTITFYNVVFMPTLSITSANTGSNATTGSSTWNSSTGVLDLGIFYMDVLQRRPVQIINGYLKLTTKAVYQTENEFAVVTDHNVSFSIGSQQITLYYNGVSSASPANQVVLNVGLSNDDLTAPINNTNSTATLSGLVQSTTGVQSVNPTTYNMIDVTSYLYFTTGNVDWSTKKNGSYKPLAGDSVALSINYN